MASSSSSSSENSDVARALADLKAANEAIGALPAPPAFSSYKRKRAQPDDLSEMEQKLADWCESAKLEFTRPRTAAWRVDEKHLENALFYLSTTTRSAILEMKMLQAKMFPACRRAPADWIFNFDVNDDAFAAYQEFVCSKEARIAFDRRKSKGSQNIRRRKEIEEKLLLAQDIWFKAMRNKFS